MGASNPATLTFAALRAANLARCEVGFRQPLNAWSRPQWIIALGGEVGEVLNVIKKLMRDSGGYAGNTQSRPELVAALGRELADCVIYLDLLLASERCPLYPLEFEADFFAFSAQNDLAFPRLGVTGAALLLLKAAGDLEGGMLFANARHMLCMCDRLASLHHIDLSAAIVDTFNRKSDRIGYAPRLELAA